MTEYNIEIKNIKGSGFPADHSVVEFSLADTKGKTQPLEGPNPVYSTDLKMHSKGPLETDQLSITVYTGKSKDEKNWQKFAHKSVPVMTLAQERKEERKKEFTIILNPQEARKEARQNQGAEDTMVTFVVEWPSEDQMKKGSSKL